MYRAQIRALQARIRALPERAVTAVWFLVREEEAAGAAV
jgi:hypothetical protein